MSCSKIIALFCGDGPTHRHTNEQTYPNNPWTTRGGNLCLYVGGNSYTTVNCAKCLPFHSVKRRSLCSLHFTLGRISLSSFCPLSLLEYCYNTFVESKNSISLKVTAPSSIACQMECQSRETCDHFAFDLITRMCTLKADSTVIISGPQKCISEYLRANFVI